MIISHVVAASQNNIIGRDGDLPWHISDDLKRFKALTTGHIMIMGRKTYDSIGRPLPGRYTVVVSRSAEIEAERVSVVPSIEAALALCAELAEDWPAEVFVVGGGEIYRQTLAQAEKIYLTRVHRDIQGDVSYPAIPEAFEQVSAEAFGDSEWPYSCMTYERHESRR